MEGSKVEAGKEAELSGGIEVNEEHPTRGRTIIRVVDSIIERAR